MSAVTVPGHAERFPPQTQCGNKVYFIMCNRLRPCCHDNPQAYPYASSYASPLRASPLPCKRQAAPSWLDGLSPVEHQRAPQSSAEAESAPWGLDWRISPELSASGNHCKVDWALVWEERRGQDCKVALRRRIPQCMPHESVAIHTPCLPDAFPQKTSVFVLFV